MPGRTLRTALAVLLLYAHAPVVAGAACVQQSRKQGWELFDAGSYEECLQLATGVVDAGTRFEAWSHLMLRSQLALGQHEQAEERVVEEQEHFPRSLQLKLLAHDILSRRGEGTRSKLILHQIVSLSETASWRYDGAEDLVTAGRARLLLGEDPKAVMDANYRAAQRESPDSLEAALAIAELALEKHDYQLAAEELARAAELAPDDPDVHYLTARAFAPSDPERATASLQRTLELNPRHKGGLLLAVDQKIGAEQYEAAGELLARILATEPGAWEAWSYRAVLAHLEGSPERELTGRAEALAHWDANPRVDHLIGRELSEKYRFREGAAYQRRALRSDPGFAEARFQLAQDLLRLGDEDEGWRLAEQVLAEDDYNVVAYNLMVLKDALAQFRTLERDGFVVRMEATEAEVYGARVLDLMEEARRELCPRYGVELADLVVVELFDEQKDFAIRTFGLPGGHGFLGVCFGDVITMNSPASQGDSPSNWEAVLWHEFCHVVTLNKTHNRMPRWLSEGISVYEERRRDPSWGQTLTPAYRARILAGDMTPVSELSSAFLSPEDGADLMFAYYQSSLVIEYMLETHGADALGAVLDDLARGVPIHAALANRMAQTAELDAGFAAYARQRAAVLAPGGDWTAVLPAEPLDLEGLLEWTRLHPDHVTGLLLCATALGDAGRESEAVPLLERAIELYPALVGPGNPYEQLAGILRTAGDEERELEVLTAWIERDSAALDARRRKMTLLEARADWEGLLEVAQSALAIQPMSPAPHRALLRAGHELARPAVVLRAGQALLALGPVDPAGAHFDVARAAFTLGDRELARREVLYALEEAPRFREAHRLLLEIAGDADVEQADRSTGDQR